MSFCSAQKNNGAAGRCEMQCCHWNRQVALNFRFRTRKRSPKIVQIRRYPDALYFLALSHQIPGQEFYLLKIVTFVFRKDKFIVRRDWEWISSPSHEIRLAREQPVETLTVLGHQGIASHLKCSKRQASIKYGWNTGLKTDILGSP
jgi:hypothetical protein